MLSYSPCPLCRMPHIMAGVGSLYFPPNGKAPIVYTLCMDCGERLAAATEEKRSELFKQVEVVLAEQGFAI